MKAESYKETFGDQAEFVIFAIVELFRIRKLVLGDTCDSQLIEDRLAAYQGFVEGGRLPIAEAVAGELEVLHHIDMGRPAVAIRCLELRVLPAYEESRVGLLKNRAARLLQKIESDTVHS